MGSTPGEHEPSADSEQTLQWLIANMSEGFALHRIVLDGQGRPCDYIFLEVNAAFEHLTGLRAGEVLGKRVTDVLPGIEKDPTDWIGRYGRVALTGEPAQFESHAVPLGKWYGVSAFSPSRGTFVVTFSDITDRKNAEAQRREAEERLLVTLRSIGDAVISTDTDGRVVLLNRVAETLTGFGQSEAAGRPLREIFPIVNENTGESVEDPVRRVLETGAMVGLANHSALVRRDGTRISIADSAAPVRSEDGGLLGVVFVFRDVTEKRRAERALAQSEAKYRNLFESMSEEVHYWQLVRDDSGHIKTWRLIDANPPALKTWGRASIEEIKGKTTDEIFGPGATEHYMPVVQRIMAEGRPLSFEDYFPNLDRTFRFTSTPLGDRFITTGADLSPAGKIARLYEVLSRVNESIVRTHDERTLFEQVCRILAEVGGFPLAWIGLVEGRDVAPVASAGPAADYLGEIKVQVDGDLGRGPTGTAVREERNVVNDDFDDNPTTTVWRLAALAHGFRASAAFPLRRQGKTVGALTLYSARPGAFDEQQVKLLESLCADVSYALDALMQERLRAGAEAALRQSEQRFRLALRNAPVSVAVQDRDFTYIWAFNQRTARPKEIVGHTDHEIFTPEEAARLMAIKRRVLEEGIELREQMWLDRPSGPVFLDVCWEPVCDEAGLVVGIASATVDLTAIKLAEEAVQRSENQLRVLVENVNAGVAFIDETGKFSLYNRQFLKMFGLAHDSDIKNVNSQDWSAWQVFDEAGRLLHVDQHPVRKAALGRRTVRDQLVGVRVPGGQNVTWMLVSAEPVFDSQGRMEGIICTYSDISERKRAEAALRATLQRFYGMLSAMQCAVLLMSDDNHVEFANPYFCQLFGLEDSPAELEGLTSAEMLSKIETAYQHPEETIKRIQDIVAAGQPVVEEALTLRHGTVLRHFVPLSLDGRSCGRLWVHFDISSQKHAEEALREVDRRKNEFLAVLSHELRNPLAPITNSLYILDHAPPAGELASRAKQVIARQVQHLSSLVNDLLDVTRISRNKIRLSKERLELNELARRAVEDNLSLFEKDEVHLELEAASRPIHVLADRTRVVQIIGNLLQNAAKFTPKGGRTRVSLDVEGVEAVVRVVDDGVGMTPETLARLFEPFMQVDQTLDRSKGGLGLGLALVKGLVELHGGSIAARSEGMGKGTEFLVRLPLDVGAALEMVSPAHARPRARRRVLIIEDNRDAADSLREVLELGEHEVEVAYNGPDGIAKAGVFKPDLVLCDIGLPHMDGYEVARIFRSDEGLKHTTLVALSGYALAEDLQRAAEAGFDRHLPKPPAIDKLEELLAGIPGSARATQRSGG